MKQVFGECVAPPLTLWRASSFPPRAQIAPSFSRLNRDRVSFALIVFSVLPFNNTFSRRIPHSVHVWSLWYRLSWRLLCRSAGFFMVRDAHRWLPHKTTFKFGEIFWWVKRKLNLKSYQQYPKINLIINHPFHAHCEPKTSVYSQVRCQGCTSSCFMSQFTLFRERGWSYREREEFVVMQMFAIFSNRCQARATLQHPSHYSYLSFFRHQVLHLPSHPHYATILHRAETPPRYQHQATIQRDSTWSTKLLLSDAKAVAHKINNLCPTLNILPCTIERVQRQ